jgi:hypothetical protein
MRYPRRIGQSKRRYLLRYTASHHRKLQWHRHTIFHQTHKTFTVFFATRFDQNFISTVIPGCYIAFKTLVHESPDVLTETWSDYKSPKVLCQMKRLVSLWLSIHNRVDTIKQKTVTPTLTAVTSYVSYVKTRCKRSAQRVYNIKKDFKKSEWLHSCLWIRFRRGILLTK